MKSCILDKFLLDSISETDILWPRPSYLEETAFLQKLHMHGWVGESASSVAAAVSESLWAVCWYVRALAGASYTSRSMCVGVCVFFTERVLELQDYYVCGPALVQCRHITMKGSDRIFWSHPTTQICSQHGHHLSRACNAILLLWTKKTAEEYWHCLGELNINQKRNLPSLPF